MKYLPHVQEAILSLGYIKPEYDTALAIMLESNEGQHPKTIALAYRKIGEQISRDEKRALGLRSNACFSREALESLTPAGFLKLRDSHVTTLLRAALSYFRSRMIDDCRKVNIYQFKVFAAFKDCPGCMKLGGQIIGSNHAAMLRPNSCAREACALSIMPWVDHLAGIK
jgi:hypothetical protein